MLSKSGIVMSLNSKQKSLCQLASTVLPQRDRKTARR